VTAGFFEWAFGLGFSEMKEEKVRVPREIQVLVNEREIYRKEKSWAEADIVRERIREKGFLVEDRDGKQILRRV